MSLEPSVTHASRTAISAHVEPVDTMVATPEKIIAPPASAPQLPSPEQVFAEWLLWVPCGADLRAAARAQIAEIDRRGSRHPDAQYLRALFVAIAGGYSRRQASANL